MTSKHIGVAAGVVLAVAVVGYFFFPNVLPFTTPAETTENVDSTSAPTAGKLNIAEVCAGALAYMTFPDAASADAFVAACVAGEHPEVIEQYKEQMDLGDGAAI